MRLHDRCILLISPEPWEGLRMSKHHWAEALAERGNRVLWLDQPQPGTGPVTLTPTRSVERVGYHHWLRGVNRMPKAVQRWYNDRLLRDIERKIDRKIDLIWSFDTSRLLMTRDTDRIRIMHPVDLAVAKHGADAMRNARVVLTVSEDIRRSILAAAPTAQVLNLGHGLDKAWLAKPPVKEADRAARPRVCCAGNMAIRYLDWEVLAAEVAAHPGVDFRFIGPCEPAPTDSAFHALRALPNVAFTGLLNKADLQQELHQADVLLLCYRSDLWPRELSNSHKLLEYLATGNPVVASATSEHEGISPKLIAMARQRWEHPALLSAVLNNLDAWQAKDVRAARTSFAQSRTIEAQLARVEQALAPLWKNPS